MKYRIMLSLALLLGLAGLAWIAFDGAGEVQAQSRAADRIIAERAVDYPTDI